ncbi:MAG: VWA domain-containing protein [Pirellula sp.]|nr:VWA domain-containing protein [Pirellula sp.]
MTTIARSLWTLSTLCIGLVSLLTLSTAKPSYAGANDYVVIVLDDSGSMREVMRRDRRSRIDAAKSSLTQVIQQIAPGTNVGVLLLNGARQNGNWFIPIGPVNPAEAIGRISNLRANGGTPLGDALRIASDELLALRSKKIYGTYRLIVVTDGEASDQALLDQYLPDILSRGIIIDAIGVDMRGDHSLATRVHSYRRADDQASLSNAIQEILAEGSGTDQGNNGEDFALLEGLGDLDVSEVLKALATPNNDKITGIGSRQASGSRAPNGGLGNSNNSPYNGPSGPVSGFPTSNPSQNPPVQKSSFFAQVFGTICTCCIPLLLVMFFISAFLTKSKVKRQ